MSVIKNDLLFLITDTENYVMGNLNIVYRFYLVHYESVLSQHHTLYSTQPGYMKWHTFIIVHFLNTRLKSL